MTAPTHVAFGILWAVCAEASTGVMVACAFGSMVPDIDHPQSGLGRVFFFLSHPLNTRFGHRGAIHGLLFWGSILTAGILLKSPLTLWVALGGLSHIALDTYNISGVRALEPFNRKPLVCFKRDWRVASGSVREIVILGLLVGLIFFMHYAQSIGGPRKLINEILSSPKITAEEYLRNGLKHCRATGQFRWEDGRIEEVDWLVVGTEDFHLVFWNGHKLVKSEREGDFLRSRLVQKEEYWNLVKVTGFVRVSEDSFWLDNEKSPKWHMAKAGSLATGTIKTPPGKVLGIEMGDSLPNINMQGWDSPGTKKKESSFADSYP